MNVYRDVGLRTCDPALYYMYLDSDYIGYHIFTFM